MGPVGRRWITGSAIVAGVGAVGVGLGSIAVRWTFGDPLAILVLAVTLAGVGIALGLAPRIAVPLLLLAALSWPEIRTWIFLAGRTGAPGTVRGLPIGDILDPYLPIFLVATMFALALWRHPPFQDREGRPVTTSRRLLALCLGAAILGPIAGLIGWLGFSPGDIYGRALVVGLLIGVIGVLTWVGAAATSYLGASPRAAAVLGVAWSVAVLVRLAAAGP